MIERRCGYDRRSVNDRRNRYDPVYLMPGGSDRRSWKGRRSRPAFERRDGWIRVTEWSSISRARLERRCPVALQPKPDDPGQGRET